MIALHFAAVSNTHTWVSRCLLASETAHRLSGLSSAGLPRRQHPIALPGKPDVPTRGGCRTTGRHSQRPQLRKAFRAVPLLRSTMYHTHQHSTPNPSNQISQRFLSNQSLRTFALLTAQVLIFISSNALLLSSHRLEGGTWSPAGGQHSTAPSVGGPPAGVRPPTGPRFPAGLGPPVGERFPVGLRAARRREPWGRAAPSGPQRHVAQQPLLGPAARTLLHAGDQLVLLRRPVQALVAVDVPQGELLQREVEELKHQENRSWKCPMGGFSPAQGPALRHPHRATCRPATHSGWDTEYTSEHM